jgi:arsenate reductase
MAEVGIDIAHYRSKSAKDFIAMPFDYVITVCDRAKETCPRWPGSTRLIHWSFDDPAAVADSDARRLIFLRVRDEIAAAIRQFLAGRD